MTERQASNVNETERGVLIALSFALVVDHLRVKQFEPGPFCLEN